MKNDYLRTQEESKCFGCSACEKECPTKAITMKENGKGLTRTCKNDRIKKTLQ